MERVAAKLKESTTKENLVSCMEETNEGVDDMLLGQKINIRL